MRQISGYLIKYDSNSSPLNLGNGKTVIERFSPNSFADSVASINAGQRSIEANIEHQQNNAIVRLGITGKNVKLEHRNDGVFATIDLIDDTISNDVFERAKAGIVNGLSIEFKPTINPSITASNGQYFRTITRADLTGFGIVAKPAYPESTITNVSESRALSAADVVAITEEIKAHEKTRGQLDIYQYEAWLLGIRS